MQQSFCDLFGCIAVMMWAIGVTDAAAHPALDPSLHIQEPGTCSPSHAQNLELLLCCHGVP